MSYINEFVSAPQPPGDDARNDARPLRSSLGLDIPLSPTVPSAVEKTRKYSPLTDLIESEKTYVELLTGIIRKVAAAWSRSNLPPSELDVMFRSVEGVYKRNRALLAKLKEIGENPSSPKVLGDLLMRWIDELEHPYMTYADRYCTGFDNWEPVKSNLKLPAVLQAFSASIPPPPILPEPTRLLNPSLWTLDALFLLPKGRLQYYRKLYSKLLKSTTPGKSDHRLLTGALGKLDDLLATLEGRANIYVGNTGLPKISLPSCINTETSSTAVIPSVGEVIESGPLQSQQSNDDSKNAAIPLRASLSSKGEHVSHEATLVLPGQESFQAISSSVLALERRLATDNTLDIFTMQLKQIRLQIAPPTLSYARELRLSSKVLVRFTPEATGIEVIHRQGHIFILSDLILLCEEMTEEERLSRGEDGRDMHLCYPPLSGKVLNVVEVPGQDNALQISVMHKETLVLEANSQLMRDRIFNEFQECISYAKMVSGALQEHVPLVPLVENPQLLAMGRARERPDRAFNPHFLPQIQTVNLQHVRGDDAASTVESTPDLSPKQSSGLSWTSVSQQYAVSSHQTFGRDVVTSPSRGPSSPSSSQGVALHHAEQAYPPRRSSTGHNSPPSSFIPGQIVPPVRNASIQSQSSPFGAPPLDLSRPGGPPVTQSFISQSSILRHHASMHSLRQQPSLHSHPHKPHHQILTPTAYPQPGPRSSDTQPFHSQPASPPMIPHPTEQSSHRLQKSSSSRSLHAQYQYSQNPLPPVPSLPDGLPMPQRPYSQRKDSMGSLNAISRPLLPSIQMGSRSNSVMEPSILDPSPPTSPAEERKPLGPVRSVITAQMKCKVFHQQQHAQWKSLGSASLTLYRQEPTNVKQLVVEAGSKEKSILISTIVLTDGVERVGKTGVAIELSDAGGARTGVIYMIQLRNEDSATSGSKNYPFGIAYSLQP